MNIVTDRHALSLPCEPVASREEGRRIAQLLHSTLEKHNRNVFRTYRKSGGKYGSLWAGIGLSAPQLGIFKRVFVLQLHGRRYTLVNPRMTDHDRNTTVVMQEACLSFPGEVVNTRRFAWVEFETEWGGTYLFGSKERDQLLRDYCLSQAAQHEYAHLFGSLMWDFDQDNPNPPDPMQWGR